MGCWSGYFPRLSKRKRTFLIMKTTRQESFTVIGVEGRTNNVKEFSGQGIIPQIWGKFMAENLLNKISDKTDGSIIAAYTDYVSDKNGDYTFFLGVKVDRDATVPEGMISRHVQEGIYQVMTSETGPIWQVVQDLWKKIWSEHDNGRSYQFDYEVYEHRATDQDAAQVDVYLSVVTIE